MFLEDGMDVEVSLIIKGQLSDLRATFGLLTLKLHFVMSTRPLLAPGGTKNLNVWVVLTV